jgi:hypothetical protein
VIESGRLKFRVQISLQADSGLCVVRDFALQFLASLSVVVVKVVFRDRKQGRKRLFDHHVILVSRQARVFRVIRAYRIDYVVAGRELVKETVLLPGHACICDTVINQMHFGCCTSVMPLVVLSEFVKNVAVLVHKGL